MDGGLNVHTAEVELVQARLRSCPSAISVEQAFQAVSFLSVFGFNFIDVERASILITKRFFSHWDFDILAGANSGNGFRRHVERGRQDRHRQLAENDASISSFNNDAKRVSKASAIPTKVSIQIYFLLCIAPALPFSLRHPDHFSNSQGIWEFLSGQTCVSPNSVVPEVECKLNIDCFDGNSCTVGTCITDTKECSNTMSSSSCCGNFICEADEYDSCSDCGVFTLRTPSISGTSYLSHGIMFDVEAVNNVVLQSLTFNAHDKSGTWTLIVDLMGYPPSLKPVDGR